MPFKYNDTPDQKVFNEIKIHNQAKLMEAVSEETKQQILLARGY